MYLSVIASALDGPPKAVWRLSGPGALCPEALYVSATLRLIEQGGEPAPLDSPEREDRTHAGNPWRSPRTETVLLVESDKSLRAIARRALRSGGYCILDAPDAPAAVRTAERSERPVDLLITDVMMYEMSGMRLADTIRRFNPLLKVLFMAGYIDDIALRFKDPLGGVAVIQKPFAPNDLATVVYRILRGES